MGEKCFVNLIIMNFQLLYLSVILLFVVGCAKPEKRLTQHEQETIIAEVTSTLNEYHDNIRMNGLLGEFKYLDSSASFSWHPPGFSTPISYDSVASIIRANALLFSSIDNHWDSLTVRPLSEVEVEYDGIITSAVFDTSGKFSTFRLRESGLMVKSADGWKLRSGKTDLIH